MSYLVAMRIIYENAELNLKRDLKSSAYFRSENIIAPFQNVDRISNTVTNLL